MEGDFLMNDNFHNDYNEYNPYQNTGFDCGAERTYTTASETVKPEKKTSFSGFVLYRLFYMSIQIFFLVDFLYSLIRTLLIFIKN